MNKHGQNALDIANTLYFNKIKTNDDKLVYEELVKLLKGYIQEDEFSVEDDIDGNYIYDYYVYSNETLANKEDILNNIIPYDFDNDFITYNNIKDEESSSDSNREDNSDYDYPEESSSENDSQIDLYLIYILEKNTMVMIFIQMNIKINNYLFTRSLRM